MSGYDVLTHLEEMPRVVFTIAFDQYALKELEILAADYLLPLRLLHKKCLDQQRYRAG